MGIASTEVTKILDYSEQTLAALVVRLNHSTEFQELISREIELDELWRRVDTAMKDAADLRATPARREALQALFAAVTEAHDLTGAGDARAGAAALLRAEASWTD